MKIQNVSWVTSLCLTPSVLLAPLLLSCHSRVTDIELQVSTKISHLQFRSVSLNFVSTARFVLSLTLRKTLWLIETDGYWNYFFLQGPQFWVTLLDAKFVYPCFWVRVGVAERRFIETCTWAKRHQNITNFTYPLPRARSLPTTPLFFLFTCMSRTIQTSFLQIIFCSLLPSFILYIFPPILVYSLVFLICIPRLCWIIRICGRNGEHGLKV